MFLLWYRVVKELLQNLGAGERLVLLEEEKGLSEEETISTSTSVSISIPSASSLVLSSLSDSSQKQSKKHKNVTRTVSLVKWRETSELT